MKSNITTFEEFEKNILDHVTQLRDLLTQGHANDNGDLSRLVLCLSYKLELENCLTS